MMRLAVIRGICALACAIAFHAAIVTGAVRLGWLSPDDTTLPELDLTSVDLSFSDTPDEIAAPVAQPPAPAVDAPLPPPPPETHTSRRGTRSHLGKFQEFDQNATGVNLTARWIVKYYK